MCSLSEVHARACVWRCKFDEKAAPRHAYPKKNAYLAPVWIPPQKKMGSTSPFLTRHLETVIKWKERKGSPVAPAPQGVIRAHLSFSPAAFLANRDVMANGRATELCLLKSGSPELPTWKAEVWATDHRLSVCCECLESRTIHFPPGRWNPGLQS